jgi:hypothetical protein
MREFYWKRARPPSEVVLISNLIATIPKPMKGIDTIMIVIAIVAPPAVRAQGVLDDIRHDVHPSTPAPAASKAPSTSGCADDADDGGIFAGLFGELFGQALLFSFEAGADALARAQPYPMLYLDYPYQGSYPGFMVRDLAGSQSLADQWQGRVAQRMLFGRVTIDEGFDFFNNVNRASGSLLLDSTTRWGAQTHWSVLSERGTTGTDALTIGNMNLTYRYFESRRIMMRAGFGANTFVDRHSNDWGFNFHLDSDWFLKRPFIATSTFDVGTLGSATLIHLRGTFGVVRQRYEFFGGYDWLQVGSTDIHGPLVGLRIWF